MFTRGQRVRCIDNDGVHNQMEVGDEFEVLKMGAGTGEYVFLSNRPTVPFYTRRFEVVAPGEAVPEVIVEAPPLRFTVGQEVVFTDVRTKSYAGVLEDVRRNTIYTIRDIRGGRAQITELWVGSWYNLARLSADPAVIARARNAAPPPPPEPPGVPASFSNIVSCCGARAVYFSGVHLLRRNMEATMQEWRLNVGLPMGVAILNTAQFNGPGQGQPSGHDLMIEFGWEHVGETASRSGSDIPLHLYMLPYKKSTRKVALSPEPVRAFGG